MPALTLIETIATRQDSADRMLRSGQDLLTHSLKLAFADRVEQFRRDLVLATGEIATAAVSVIDVPRSAIESPAMVALVNGEHRVEILTSTRFLRSIHRTYSDRSCSEVLRDSFTGLFPELKNYTMQIVEGETVRFRQHSPLYAFELCLDSFRYPLVVKSHILSKHRASGPQLSGVRKAALSAVQIDCEMKFQILSPKIPDGEFSDTSRQLYFCPGDIKLLGALEGSSQCEIQLPNQSSAIGFPLMLKIGESEICVSASIVAEQSFASDTVIANYSAI